jgi:hypothetical protein
MAASSGTDATGPTHERSDEALTAAALDFLTLPAYEQMP